MKKFSIIVPVYNNEKYIKKCINSIIMQTYKNLELIIINDGSKDDSGIICDEFAKKDNRIKVIHKKNEGVSIARNRGIEEVTGDYILFIDSDDWIKEDTIEILNEKIQKSDTDLLIYQIFNREFNKKDVLKTKNKDEFLKYLRKIIIKEFINSPVNKVYNTKIIKKNKIKFAENIDIAEDLLFNILYFSNIDSFEIINEKLYYYNHENTKSLTKRFNNNKYVQLMKVDDQVETILSIYENKKINNAIKYIRIKNIFSCIIELSKKECNLTLNIKKKLIKKMQKENKIKIIIDNGVKPFCYSIVYNLITIPSLLYFLTKFRRIKWWILFIYINKNLINFFMKG